MDDSYREDDDVFTMTWDNVQFKSNPRQETQEKGPTMHLFGLAFATQNRVPCPEKWTKAYFKKPAAEVPLEHTLPNPGRVVAATTGQPARSRVQQ